MYKPKTPLITAVWFTLTIIIIGLTITADYNRIQKNLTNNTHYVYSSVYEKTYINEVLLQNFTALVSANPSDQKAIRNFANDIRKRYPHIFRLQIQQQTLSNQSNEISNKRKATLDSFEPVFGSVADDLKTTGTSRFPITFLEPLNADTRYLLGNDLLTDNQFTETLSFAQRYHQPVASSPFSLAKSSTAYALFLAFYDRNIAPKDNNLYIASLIIDISSLLPGVSFLNQGAEIIMTDEYGAVLDRRTSTEPKLIASQWFPSVEDRRTINRFGQSFELRATQQVGVENLSLGLLIAILGSSCGGYLLLAAYLQQKARIGEQHSRIYKKLRTQRQQLEQSIHSRTLELHDQLIENRRLTHQVLAVQEKERRNLSRELHDELGQSLTAIRTDAKILKRIHPEENSIVHQVSESIDAVAQNIYDVTYGLMRTLRPAALDDLGLLDALQECIASNHFDEHHITLHSDFRGALNDMSEDYNITLFRLTQEAFSNIIKHSRANNVWIEVHRVDGGLKKEISGDRIELMISDDGIGFDIKQQGFKKGFGLIGMRERVRALGGDFQVQSNHDRGIRIGAIIPIAAEHSTMAAIEAKLDQAEPAEHEH
ncbi:MAG: ATP-binding protein [Amphritea sp.]